MESVYGHHAASLQEEREEFEAMSKLIVKAVLENCVLCKQLHASIRRAHELEVGFNTMKSAANVESEDDLVEIFVSLQERRHSLMRYHETLKAELDDLKKAASKMRKKPGSLGSDDGRDESDTLKVSKDLLNRIVSKIHDDKHPPRRLDRDSIPASTQEIEKFFHASKVNKESALFHQHLMKHCSHDYVPLSKDIATTDIDVGDAAEIQKLLEVTCLDVFQRSGGK